MKSSRELVECWSCHRLIAKGSDFCGFGDCRVHQLIGRTYKPVQKLGEGRFAIVYKAYNLDIFDTPPTDNDDYVAIKVFKNPSQDSEMVKKELRLLTHLPSNNPNLVRIREGTCRLYVVMDFIPGCDLHRLIRDAKTAHDHEDQSRAAALVAKIRSDFDTFLLGLCRGLTGLHTSEMIHRDLKPKNILVTEDGIPKIVDMGLGKLVANSPAHSRVGSLEVLAPEVLRPVGGNEYDYRVDLWALGVLIYFVWSDKYPFGNQIASDGVRDADWTDENTLISRIRHDDPDPLIAANPNTPSHIADLVRHLLVRNPDRRMRSAEAVANAVGRLPYDKARPTSDYLIGEYQKQVSKLYSLRNAPASPTDLLGRVLGHVGYLCYADDGAVRAIAEKHLPRAFAWLCALTEAAGWNVTDVIRHKYPDICPYCEESVCTMEHPTANEAINQALLERLRRDRDREISQGNQGATAQEETQTKTFRDVAAMFDRIYGPYNDPLGLVSALEHFHSEADEFFEALFTATAVRDPDFTAVMFFELADVYAWLFAICNQIDKDMTWFEESFWDTYKTCHKCGGVPCSCPPQSFEAVLKNWRLSSLILDENPGSEESDA